MPGVSEHFEHADSDELAQFGYKQELDRSLGSFSSFAAGFSYISILTGVFQLFGFAFLLGGPRVLLVVADRLHRPVPRRALLRRAGGAVPAGRIGLPVVEADRPGVHLVDGGWLLLVGSIVTVAAVAVAYQVILPQVTTWFQFVGSKADAGLYRRRAARRTRCCSRVGPRGRSRRS